MTNFNGFIWVLTVAAVVVSVASTPRIYRSGMFNDFSGRINHNSKIKSLRQETRRGDHAPKLLLADYEIVNVDDNRDNVYGQLFKLKSSPKLLRNRARSGVYQPEDTIIIVENVDNVSSKTDDDMVFEIVENSNDADTNDHYEQGSEYSSSESGEMIRSGYRLKDNDSFEENIADVLSKKTGYSKTLVFEVVENNNGAVTYAYEQFSEPSASNYGSESNSEVNLLEDEVKVIGNEANVLSTPVKYPQNLNVDTDGAQAHDSKKHTVPSLGVVEENIHSVESQLENSGKIIENGSTVTDEVNMENQSLEEGVIIDRNKTNILSTTTEYLQISNVNSVINEAENIKTSSKISEDKNNKFYVENHHEKELIEKIFSIPIRVLDAFKKHLVRKQKTQRDTDTHHQKNHSNTTVVEGSNGSMISTVLTPNKSHFGAMLNIPISILKFVRQKLTTII